MKTFSLLIASILAFNLFACADNFNGKFIDQNAESNLLEMKVLDCSPKIELSFPAESRTGHVIADNVDRLIWNRNDRTISEKASIKNNILTINIVDKDLRDTFFQNQVYTLTPNGLELFIEIFNTNHAYDYKKHFVYDRE